MREREREKAPCLHRTKIKANCAYKASRSRYGITLCDLDLHLLGDVLRERRLLVRGLQVRPGGVGGLGGDPGGGEREGRGHGGWRVVGGWEMLGKRRGV